MAWRGDQRHRRGSLPRSVPDAGGEQLRSPPMEPTSARRLLPCWDEPAFRARFRLSVDLPSGYAAYSNMPVAKSGAARRGAARVAFEATPPMATYLLALVAGDLERLAGARRRHASRHRHEARQARPARVRARGEQTAAALLQRLFRHALPAAQARPDRDAGRLPRRDGELGRDRLQRVRPARRPPRSPERRVGSSRPVQRTRWRTSGSAIW